MKSLYLIGSLRNPEIPTTAEAIRRATGLEVFDDWYAAGPEADDYWKAYETDRGHDFQTALKGWAANNVFSFDKTHLDRVDATLLVLPAGRSGHLELGYSIGSGKRGFILLAGEPDRFDVMYRFAERVFVTLDEAIEFFNNDKKEAGNVQGYTVEENLHRWPNVGHPGVQLPGLFHRCG